MKHVSETYSCDRCKADLGGQKPKQNMHVVANKDGEWAPEFAIEWRDFCDRCNKAVTEFFTT